MNVYVRELTRTLTQQGMNIDVFTLWHDGLDVPDVSFADSARFIHVDMGEDGSVPKEATFDLLPQFTSQVLDYVERNGLEYDVIHSHYWLSAWVGERLKSSSRVPHVATFHTLARVKERAQPEHPEPESRKQTEDKLISSVERIIALTASERADLTGLYNASPNKITVAPAGVDLSLFKPVEMAEARARLSIEASKVLLFVGRLDPLKGGDILLRAFALLARKRNAHLIFVGGNAAEHDEGAKLKGLAQELDIANMVDFHGPVNQNVLPLYYSAANATVVPSLHESFCLVAIESLACGTPVIASNRGGLSTTIIDGENGFLVDELSPEAFARRLAQLLDDEVLEAQLRAQARDSVQKYSWDAVATAVLGEYEALQLTACSCCG